MMLIIAIISLLSLAPLLPAGAAASTSRSPTTGPDWAAAQFGDWTVIIAPEFTQASTTGSEDAEFGFVCGQECLGFLDLHQRCEEGRSYSGTADVDGRRFVVGTSCYRIDGNPILVLDADLALLAAIGAGSRLQITVKLDGGATGKAIFSLHGCAQALLMVASVQPPAPI